VINLLDLSLDKIFQSLWLFNQPQARLYYLNLLGAFCFIAFIYFFKKSERESIKSFFSISYWLHASSRTDLFLFIFNGFFKLILIAPFLIGSYQVATFVMKSLYVIFGFSEPILLSEGLLLTIFTIMAFVINDFFRFFLHFLMHKISFLWRFHEIHHSAVVLTPLSLHRAHPVEVALASVRNVLSAGLSAGLFMFLFQKQVGGLDILGVNLIGFLFNFLGSNLRHSPIWIGYGPLEYLFISPAQHQIHHAKDKKYYDTNLGVALSIWDQLFGTFMTSKGERVKEFGVGSYQKQNLLFQLTNPFRR